MKSLRAVDLQPWHTLASPALGRELLQLERPEELVLVDEDDLILGGGSNVICWPEVRRRLVQLCFTDREILAENADSVHLRVGAGLNWAELVHYCCEQGWYGLENLAAIPGTVGAAPVQNIGAFGVEVGELISQLEVYDRRTKRFFWLGAAEAQFGYRQSLFKRQRAWWITRVELVLKRRGPLRKDYDDLADCPATTPAAMMAEISARRAARLPDPKIEPNAGSFFHNVLLDASAANELHRRAPDAPLFPQGDRWKVPSAWLIERCGLKGQRVGRVGISERHALVLTNRGGDGEEILAFAALVQAEVAKRFGLSLQIEPELLR